MLFLAVGILVVNSWVADAGKAIGRKANKAEIDRAVNNNPISEKTSTQYGHCVRASSGGLL